MKRLYLFVFLMLALSGCTLGPSQQVREKLWHAPQEQPNTFGYQAYLLFQDDGHFIYWRTMAAPDQVLSRFDYYSIDNGSTEVPVTFTRNGDQLHGESRRPVRSRTGELIYTRVESFKGRFIGDTLDMEMRKTTVWPDRPTLEESPVHWTLKRLVQ